MDRSLWTHSETPLRGFLEKSDNEKDHCKNDKDVDETTEEMESQPANQPEDEENDRDCIKHTEYIIATHRKAGCANYLASRFQRILWTGNSIAADNAERAVGFQDHCLDSASTLNPEKKKAQPVSGFSLC